MRVTVLVENATPSSRLAARHGLSLFLEIGRPDASPLRILFDMGPDSTLVDNARVLGVDLSTADLAVVSHGHADHGGGLGAYLAATPSSSAPVYVRPGAFARHLSGTPERRHDISLDPTLAACERIVWTSGVHGVAPGVTLFSDVARHAPEPASNERLFEVGEDGGLLRDAFSHEQSLLVEEAGRAILVSGCSHAGILNIMDRAEELAGRPLDAVVAGFHLTAPSAGAVEDAARVEEIAFELERHPASYYTFHCTGMAAFGILRDVLGSRVTYLACGGEALV